MRIFKDIKLMSIDAMKKEARNIFTAYPNQKSMPSDLFIRINILMTEIKRKEAFDLFEKEKLEKAEYEAKLLEKNITGLRDKFNSDVEINKLKNN